MLSRNVLVVLFFKFFWEATLLKSTIFNFIETKRIYRVRFLFVVRSFHSIQSVLLLWEYFQVNFTCPTISNIHNIGLFCFPSS